MKRDIMYKYLYVYIHMYKVGYGFVKKKTGLILSKYRLSQSVNFK